MNAIAPLIAAVEIGDPLTRGTLSLFPLFHELAPSPVAYVSGPAVADLVSVSELAGGAAVPVLEVTNGSDAPLLLLDGETLLGAKQNRIVTVTTVVAPHVTEAVPVTCVEAGRWGEERPVARSDRHAPSAIRAHNRRSVSDAAARGVDVENDQGAVWVEVDRYAARFGTASPTGALEDIHASAADRVRALVGDTKPLAGQCGVVAAVDQRILAVDLFDRPDTLAVHWDALVAGYALDADQRKATKRPRRRDVRRLLAELANADAAVVGNRVHATSERTTATAVRLDRTIVHLAVSTAA